MAVDRHSEYVHRMPVWKSYLYYLQQQAPKPKRIVCNVEAPNKPSYYGREYHGAISREDADFLLTIQGEGSYLIRESQRAPGQYTLAIRCSEPANENQRFEGVTKNFKLYYDGKHYVGEKRFDTINDLVADGLITFYLESKAADYIATLSSRSNYAESPYVAYNTHKKQQLNLASSPTSGPKTTVLNDKGVKSQPLNDNNAKPKDHIDAVGSHKIILPSASPNLDDDEYEQPVNNTPVLPLSGSNTTQSVSSSNSNHSNSSNSSSLEHLQSQKSNRQQSQHTDNGFDENEEYDIPLSNKVVTPAIAKKKSTPHRSDHISREAGPTPIQNRRRQKRDSASSSHGTPSHHTEIREQLSSSANSTPSHQPASDCPKGQLKQSKGNKREQHTKDTHAHEQLARRRSAGTPKIAEKVSTPQRASVPSNSSALPNTSTPPAVPPHATPVHITAGAAPSNSVPASVAQSPASQRVPPPTTPQMGSRSKVNLPVEGRLSQILESRKQQDASLQGGNSVPLVTTAAVTDNTTSVVAMTTVTTVTTTSSTNSDHSLNNGRVSNSTNTEGPYFSSSPSSTGSSSRWSQHSVLGYDKSHRYKIFEDSGHFATPPSSPPASLLSHSPGGGMGSPCSGVGSPGVGGVIEGKASSVSWCANYLSVKGCAKTHNFKLYTFKGPHWCDFCANFLWGLIAQGVKCQDCGFNAHKKCSEKVPNDCMPDMRYVKRMFGVDLTTLVKAQNTLIPVVVEMCIKEIEERGLEAEGLYRVAGFHDDVEAIKMSFDKEGELTDISEERYEDLNTITSLLKLYFRLLPIPLVTFDIYYKVIELIKQETLPLEDKIEQLKQILSLLPPAHYHTLKYLMGHLNRVVDLQQSNMMTAENISIVFAPTLLRCPENDDPLTSLNAVKYERELVEHMVTNYTRIYE